MEKKDLIYLGIIGALIATIITVIVVIPSNFNITTKVVSEPSAGAAGDVSRTPKIHQIGLTAATNTPCAMLNSDGRDRIITKVYSWNADDIGGTGPTSAGISGMVLLVSTSTSASYRIASSTLASQAFVIDATWATSTPGAYYSSSTPATAANNTKGLYVWPSNSYFRFQLLQSGSNNALATTSASMTGFCGVEYYLDM